MLLTVLRRRVWCNSYVMVFEKVLNDVAFCIAYSVVDYLNVSFNGIIISVWKDRADFPAFDYSYNYVVSVWRGFLSLLVPRTDGVILLWPSMCLPYGYFEIFN